MRDHVDGVYFEYKNWETGEINWPLVYARWEDMTVHICIAINDDPIAEGGEKMSTWASKLVRRLPHGHVAPMFDGDGIFLEELTIGRLREALATESSCCKCADKKCIQVLGELLQALDNFREPPLVKRASAN
jgi:hypothetical protein